MPFKQHPVVMLIFFSGFFLSKNSCAQQYVGAVGIRFSYGFGITGKYIFNQQKGHGLEFLLRYGYHGLIINKPGGHIQALYEKHWEFGKNRNWTVYVGGGPGFGFGKRNSLSKNTYFAFCLSPIVGIDFTTRQLRVPMVLAFDYKPAFHTDVLISKGSQKPQTDFSYYEIAFSVRFAINGKKRRY